MLAVAAMRRAVWWQSWQCGSGGSRAVAALRQCSGSSGGGSTPAAASLVAAEAVWGTDKNQQSIESGGCNGDRNGNDKDDN